MKFLDDLRRRWFNMLPNPVFSLTPHWRPGRLARNTAHAGVWNLVRVALQAASLVLLARVLGAKGYGALAGSVALFMTIGQFTGLGSGTAFVRHVARGGDLHSSFVGTARVYLLTGLVLFVLALPFAIYLLGAAVGTTALACLAAAEVLVAPALKPFVFRYQAEERMFRSSMVDTLVPAGRLAAVVLLALLGLHDVTSFAALYLLCACLVVGATLLVAWPRGGNSEAAPTTPVLTTLREGAPYAVSGFAVTSGGELDKTLLLRLAGEVVTGTYAAAYRIASAATLPVNALILSASPRLFKAESGKTGKLIGAMLATVLGYAVIAAAVLWLLAPLTPWLLGHDFMAAVPLLRGLCVVVVTGCLRQFVVALLTTRDLQKSRNLIEIGGVCVSLTLLAVLVPRYGAFGAIVAVACGDLAILSVGTLALNWHRPQHSTLKAR